MAELSLKEQVKSIIKIGIEESSISDVCEIREPQQLFSGKNLFNKTSYHCASGLRYMRKCSSLDDIQLYYKPPSNRRKNGVWACKSCYYAYWDYDGVKVEDALNLTLWLKFNALLESTKLTFYMVAQ